MRGIGNADIKKTVVNQDIPDNSGRWTGRLKVSRQYLCDDPILIEASGKYYAFVKLMDRYHSRGLIGYAEILEPKQDSEVRIVADFGCHTSYSWYL